MAVGGAPRQHDEDQHHEHETRELGDDRDHQDRQLLGGETTEEIGGPPGGRGGERERDAEHRASLPARAQRDLTRTARPARRPSTPARCGPQYPSNSSGSPSTTTRSARLPGSIVPSSSCRPISSAALDVAACSACSGVKPLLGHVPQLVEVRAVRSHRAVGAHRHLHPGIGRQPERVELGPPEPAELVAHGGLHLRVGGELLGGVAGGERGTSQVPRSTIIAARLLVQVRPVVDRAHARAHRALDALGAVRVRHHPVPRSAAVRTIASTSSWEKFGSIGSSAGEKNPPEDAILIDVGARADHLAHLARHPVDPVAHPGRHPRIRTRRRRRRRRSAARDRCGLRSSTASFT